ncbi:DUF3331 domain-containing protein [Paraburkholderia hospita]|uniref:DUF3331 domain-containing protein n=1 Tax=Paraburkholderia hospita TaxID=169430 RepID=UPI000271ADD2|nr:DUF3331 domain-containing protein [Paraburkholderia hospita]EUC12373.1 Protein of unknown function DUF3331 [Burkholderia sp. BT03]SKC52324.1 protein of unknown function [Paraburkholderia hospita]
MQDVIETDHTWFHTMALLSPDESFQVSRRGAVQEEYRRDFYRTCAIKVLERHGQTVATVAWADSTACCYGEQLWRRCVARRDGICALSGQVIAKGDAVYCPRLVQPVPRNIQAMILASALEAIPSADVI